MILGQIVGTGAGQTLFKARANTLVSTISVSNSTGGAISMVIYVVPDGVTTPAAVHALYSAVSVAANSSMIATLGLPLSKGDWIQVTGASLVFHAYGVEM